MVAMQMEVSVSHQQKSLFAVLFSSDPSPSPGSRATRLLCGRCEMVCEHIQGNNLTLICFEGDSFRLFQKKCLHESTSPGSRSSFNNVWRTKTKREWQQLNSTTQSSTWSISTWSVKDKNNDIHNSNNNNDDSSVQQSIPSMTTNST